MAILTISRELGASGTYIALKVAEKMGYTCYDQQIINEIAEKMGKKKDQLEHFDQSTYNRIGVIFKEALNSLAQGGMVFHPFGIGTINWDATEMFSTFPQNEFKEQDYYDVLKQVMSDIAEKGNAIILGRGGCHLLKNQQKAIHIRVVANYEDRITHVIKEELNNPIYNNDPNYKVGENPEEDREKAENLIRNWDTASENFIADFFDSDWNDSHGYSLVINTSKIQLNDAVDMIVRMLKAIE